MFLTQIHTDSHKSYISVHNSTGSANIKTILNIIFIIMRTIELQSCFDLLESLQSSTSEVFPHFSVTLTLYHARFSHPDSIKRLFDQFILLGYNPLRRTSKYESILINNIWQVVCKATPLNPQVHNGNRSRKVSKTKTS